MCSKNDDIIIQFRIQPFENHGVFYLKIKIKNHSFNDKKFKIGFFYFLSFHFFGLEKLKND